LIEDGRTTIATTKNAAEKSANRDEASGPSIVEGRDGAGGDVLGGLYLTVSLGGAFDSLAS